MKTNFQKTLITFLVAVMLITNGTFFTQYLDSNIVTCSEDDSRPDIDTPLTRH